MRSALLGELADLVLPSSCAGCRAQHTPLSYGACADCVDQLEALQPYATAPTPAPPGMPFCVTVGPYAAVLREVLLAYKERGRHRLARPLGALLATAVAAIAPRGLPVTLIPVPSTAAAIRARNGDHMARLAKHAARRLRAAGWSAETAGLLQALPRVDSASLNMSDRLAAAESSLRMREARIGVPRRGSSGRGTLIVVDDIVTSGATLAAVTSRMREANLQVSGAAVLAATRLRKSSVSPAIPIPPGGTG